MQLGFDFKVEKSPPVLYHPQQVIALLMTLGGKGTLIIDGRAYGPNPEPQGDMLCLDIETYKDPDNIHVHAKKAPLCFWGNRISIIGLSDRSHAWFFLHPAPGKNEMLENLLYNYKIVGANLKFDFVQLLAHHEINPMVVDIHWDVILASQLYHAGISNLVDNSLKGLAKEYLGIELDKHVALSFSHRPVHEDGLLYNLSDLEIPFALMDIQKNWELWKPEDLAPHFRAIGWFAEMEYRGVPYDVEETKRVMFQWQEHCDELAANFQKRYGISVTAQSAKLAKALKRFGYEFDSTSKEFTMQSECPAALELLRHRNSKTFLDSFKRALNSDHNGDGHAHCSYKQVAKEGVGRSSSSKCPDGTGGNLQNIPKQKNGELYEHNAHIPNFRAMVKPPKPKPGKSPWKLWTFDLSGAHQAISVTLSGCEDSIAFLYGEGLKGTDSHCEVASFALKAMGLMERSGPEIYKGAKSETPNKLDEVLRGFSKECYYSVQNGATEFSIARTVRTFFTGIIPNLRTDNKSLIEYGKAALQALQAVYPRWMNYILSRPAAIKRKVKKHTRAGVFSPLMAAGYPYWVRPDAEVKHCTAVNWQRVEGLVMYQIAHNIRMEYPDMDEVQFVLFVHDELVLLIREDRPDIARRCEVIARETFHSFLDERIRPTKPKDGATMLKDVWEK